jgi:hypothetical protein
VKKELDAIEHLAWAMPGIKVLLDKFRATGDLHHVQQALLYARQLDAQWRDLLADLEQFACEPTSPPCLARVVETAPVDADQAATLVPA